MLSGSVEAALALPTYEVAERLLALPEDQWLDRKSIRVAARTLADWLIGFANAEGGTLVIGLHDGRVEGIDGRPDHVNALRQASIDFCVPPARARAREIACVNAAGRSDHLLLLSIDPGEVVHTNVRDQVFLRVGDENRRLTFVQRQELTFDRGQSSYEARTVPQTSASSFDEVSVRGYAEVLGAPDASRLLRNRGLVIDGRPTFAGLLLFGVHPQQHVPEAFVRVLRYRGRERGSGRRQELRLDVRLEGPIPEQIEQAKRHVREHQPVRRALLPEGRFGHVALVPEDAWLEGLVNAVVHRSYSLAGDHIRAEIFDDRIEISSPGRFPGLVDPARPWEATRFARNPRIARVCAELDFGQELGEGIRRIFDEMRLAGLVEPVYRQGSALTVLTLSAEPADRALEARLPEGAREVLGALRDAERLSTSEVAGVLGVGRPTAIRRLRALQQAEMVRWVGKSPKDPRAYWSLPPT